MPTDDGPLLGPLLILGRVPSRSVPSGALREFLGEITRRLARGRGVVCLIANDRELRRLNRQFLGKDYATDVLSFPAGDGLADGGGSLGEIAISVDRAAAQAKEYGHSLADELRILMLHGVLHLAGFDHEKDSGEMRDTETRWRKRFGLPLGLIERATAGAPGKPRVQNIPRRTAKPIAQSRVRSDVQPKVRSKRERALL
jgi:probable rRNA maturation factor